MFAIPAVDVCRSLHLAEHTKDPRARETLLYVAACCPVLQLDAPLPWQRN
jgi:hypothetical protein